MRNRWQSYRERFYSADKCAPVTSAERGTALLMILLAMFAIGMMAMVLAQVAATEIAISSNIAASAASFLPADGASEVMFRDVVEMARTLGRFPTDGELATISQPSFSNITLSEFAAFANGPAGRSACRRTSNRSSFG